MSSVPIGRIGDLCEQVRGVTYSKGDAVSSPRSGFKPVLRANNITENGLTFDDLVFVPETNVSARQHIKKNDIVIAASSGSISVVGKAARAFADFDGGFGAFCKVLRPSQKVDSGYFSHFFQTKSYRQRISHLAAGANINNLRSEHLDGLEIPLPPLTEQHRIAAILDKADALRAKRREAIAKLDALTMATFYEICGSSLGPPVSIEKPDQRDADSYVPLTEIARLATGHTPSRRVPEYWGGQIPWISLTDIRRLDGRLAEATEQSTNERGIANSSAVVLPKRTVCFSRTASVGFATLLGQEMATSQDFVNWICGERIDPFYLLTAFRASKRYLVSKSTGSTHKTIYFPVAERFHVFLPDISKQHMFGEALRKIWKLRSELETQVSSVDAFFESLQQRAFTGTL